MKDNFKRRNRLGMYFGIKSGVRDDKFGNTEEIIEQLQHAIIVDVNFA